MPESESGALPLGDTPLMMNPEGFEPPAHGLEVRCSIQLSYESTVICYMERVKGIGPSRPAWKAGALPLSYTRIMYLCICFFLFHVSHSLPD